MHRLLILALLTGCVTSRPVSLPNGAQGLAISCPGTARDIADCMNKAAEICGGPYTVLTRDGERVGGVVQPSGNGAVLMSGIKRTMIVQCGD